MRKVVEVFPAIHEAVVTAAHNGNVKVNLLASVLLAYGVEHIQEALADADRLLTEWDKPVENEPILKVIRSVRTP